MDYNYRGVCVMQSWGPRGMVRYYHKWKNYPGWEVAEGNTNIEYELKNKQTGPRGRLPICPPTCFVTGGLYPSNTLQEGGQDSAPEGLGLDYYDTIKGTAGGVERKPTDPHPVTPAVPAPHTGPPFHANASDVVSGDVKFFIDEDGIDWAVWIGTNQKVYAKTLDKIVQGTITEYKTWTVDLPALYQVAYPLPAGTTHPYRNIRIDPKRSVIAKHHLTFFMSVCDWEIKPGMTVAFSDVDYLGRCNTNASLEFEHVDDATGEVLDYNPYAKTIGFPTMYTTAYIVTSDDSYKILSYKHYIVTIDLNNKNFAGTVYTARVATFTLIHTEEKSGKMAMTISPFFYEMAIDWSLCCKLFYSADGVYGRVGGQLLAIFADGQQVQSGGLPPGGGGPPFGPYPGTWSDKCSVSFIPNVISPASIPWLCREGAWPVPCEHGETVTHWVYDASMTSPMGAAQATWFDLTEPPDKTVFKFRRDIQETIPAVPTALVVKRNPSDRAPSHATAEVKAPDESVVASLLVDSGHADPSEIWTLPIGPPHFIPSFTGPGGSWEYWQYNLATFGAGWDFIYYAKPVYNIYVMTSFASHCQHGNDTFIMWLPWPYAQIYYKEGDELLSDIDNVFQDCMCSDSFFSDITVYEKNDSVNTTVISFIRWGSNGKAFGTPGQENALDTSVPGAMKYPMNKNNHPGVEREARANMRPYYYTINVTDGSGVNLGKVLFNGSYLPSTTPTFTSIPLVFDPAILVPGYWTGNTFTPYASRSKYNKIEIRGMANWYDTYTAVDEPSGEAAFNNSIHEITFAAGLASADTHTLNTFGYASYDANAILCKGSTTVGRHQQIIIPFKPRSGYLGDMNFLSTIGATENDVSNWDWYNGTGAVRDKSWLDSNVYKGCLSTRTITTPMIQYTTAPGVYSYVRLIGGVNDPLASDTFCKWAARVDTTLLSIEKNWLVWGKQTIKYTPAVPVVPATEEKFSILKHNFFDYTSGIPTEVNITPSGNYYINGVLGDGYAITPSTSAAIDAYLFFSYNDLTNQNRLIKVSIMDHINDHLDVLSGHLYDQMIVEKPVEGSSKIYLYALCKTCGKLDIIDTADLSIKKTIDVTWNTMTSGRKGGIIGRSDVAVGQGVKTTVEYFEYDFVSQMGSGTSSKGLDTYMPIGWK